MFPRNRKHFLLASLALGWITPLAGAGPFGLPAPAMDLGGVEVYGAPARTEEAGLAMSDGARGPAAASPEVAPAPEVAPVVEPAMAAAPVTDFVSPRAPVQGPPPPRTGPVPPPPDTVLGEYNRERYGEWMNRMSLYGDNNRNFFYYPHGFQPEGPAMVPPEKAANPVWDHPVFQNFRADGMGYRNALQGDPQAWEVLPDGSRVPAYAWTRRQGGGEVMKLPGQQALECGGRGGGMCEPYNATVDYWRKALPPGMNLADVSRDPELRPLLHQSIAVFRGVQPKSESMDFLPHSSNPQDPRRTVFDGIRDGLASNQTRTLSIGKDQFQGVRHALSVQNGWEGTAYPPGAPLGAERVPAYFLRFMDPNRRYAHADPDQPISAFEQGSNDRTGVLYYPEQVDPRDGERLRQAGEGGVPGGVRRGRFAFTGAYEKWNQEDGWADPFAVQLLPTMKPRGAPAEVRP